MNFCPSIIIAELWRPEVARRWKSFFENDPLPKNFQNSVSKGFIAKPIDVLCSNFVKFGRREIAYLTKNSPGSAALATMPITPKICHGQPQTTYS